MSYLVRSTKTYRTAHKRISRHKNFDQNTLNEVIDTLARGEALGLKHHDHQLTGDLAEYRECHIEHNLLLMYQIQASILALLLVKIGTHDDLFG